jgi:hypothetical protein
MTQRDYQRQYYQRRKGRGCIDCRCEKLETQTRCKECAKIHRQNSNLTYRIKVLS